MKIGVMTFHNALSHGAMLQAYSLQKTLEKMGNDVEIINYNRFYKKNINIISACSIMGKIKAFGIKLAIMVYRKCNKKNIEIKDEKFSDFRKKYLKISLQEFNTIEELRNATFDYDAYITGSDQVWNPDSINHSAFYFTFLDKKAKTIAYAPSIGVSEISNIEIRNKMKQYLEHVKFLSCREYDGAKVIADITKRPVINVLDPTLLMDYTEWANLIKKKKSQRPYVLCYFLGSLQYGRRYAKCISDKLQYDLVIIPQSPIELFSLHKKEIGVGPIEFLQLFEGAAVICTDSFHGTAFAINFQKPFFSFCRRNPKGTTSRISRIQDILAKVNLSERLIMPGDKFNAEKLYINYEEPIKLLEKERNNSLNYLEKALNNKGYSL